VGVHKRIIKKKKLAFHFSFFPRPPHGATFGGLAEPLTFFQEQLKTATGNS
jgi:hypothetical protein